MGFRLWFQLLWESIRMAVESLWLNKLRASLSILGITIGIFCIVAVFTVTDSMEHRIRENISSIGNDVVFVQKWPFFNFKSDYPWWKYMNRPNTNYAEFQKVQRKMEAYAHTVFMVNFGSKKVEAGSQSVDNVSINAVTYDYAEVKKFDLVEGRYFTHQECEGGNAVSMIGSDIAQALFPNQSALGQSIQAEGRKSKVIGVFTHEGESLMRNSLDNVVLIPVNYARGFINLENRAREPMLMIKAHSDVTLEEMSNELTGVMRSVRRLRPDEEDNFAINKITLAAENLDKLFGIIHLAGWFIGLLSILVGGFGIANIMFVSVKERTHQIGIQKALGATRRFILMEFLTESVVLCAFGGAFGMGAVWLLTFVGSRIAGFEIFLSQANIVQGSLLSIFIGLIFGILPAWRAATLRPVEAMRSV